MIDHTMNDVQYSSIGLYDAYGKLFEHANDLFKAFSWAGRCSLRCQAALLGARTIDSMTLNRISQDLNAASSDQ